MAVNLELYIKTEVLETILNTLKKKQEKGANITVSIFDEINQYGQNVISYISQSKEEREIKKPRYYVGNGKVFWDNGIIVNAVKEKKSTEITINAPTPVQQNIQQSDDDLPF